MKRNLIGIVAILAAFSAIAGTASAKSANLKPYVFSAPSSVQITTCSDGNRCVQVPFSLANNTSADVSCTIFVEETTAFVFAGTVAANSTHSEVATVEGAIPSKLTFDVACGGHKVPGLVVKVTS